ncbi:uncharacterized protein CLUP02_02091 [Colletotrichum lupini]|uniref:Uncharacterized protein n=2 Tax=Colletotrichum acutatum species complex TaxID=2707335 RepID=A0A9Q8SF98_9PEZI|nr:uncharacterized protein CLUP02_02091 [Colletotrichum lupini]XP_060374097.1 uncharacterized protein CTAM01_15313 [Colletotrichum tamarilloi]KAI3541983.1 hypothetical protein CSPX01_07210 [Colletotrichum filicis]KAK1476832.1 hypothetical protein CTAM01_15313 [Colletotrichum tamarilloi]UQC75437.1 hypothetical protein CLUP02_02091 [Colletotrichum lupini]
MTLQITSLVSGREVKPECDPRPLSLGEATGSRPHPHGPTFAADTLRYFARFTYDAHLFMFLLFAACPHFLPTCLMRMSSLLIGGNCNLLQEMG